MKTAFTKPFLSILLGFIGWYLINSVLWVGLDRIIWLEQQANPNIEASFGFYFGPLIILFSNLVAMIAVIILRRLTALGALLALGTNAVLVVAVSGVPVERLLAYFSWPFFLITW